MTAPKRMQTSFDTMPDELAVTLGQWRAKPTILPPEPRRGTEDPGPDEPDPTTWRERAACAGMDTAMFFPGRGDTRGPQAAKAICEGCPVVGQCAEWAIPQSDLHGVFGGLTERQRRNLRTAAARQRREGATPPPAHGVAGYRRHGCRCQVCTDAAADAVRVSKARARGVEPVPCPQCGRPYDPQRLARHLVDRHREAS